MITAAHEHTHIVVHTMPTIPLLQQHRCCENNSRHTQSGEHCCVNEATGETKTRRRRRGRVYYDPGQVRSVTASPLQKGRRAATGSIFYTHISHERQCSPRSATHLSIRSQYLFPLLFPPDPQKIAESPPDSRHPRRRRRFRRHCSPSHHHVRLVARDAC